MALKKVKTLTIKLPAGAIAIDRGDLDDYKTGSWGVYGPLISIHAFWQRFILFSQSFVLLFAFS